MPPQDNLKKILEEGMPPGLAYWMGRIDTKISKLTEDVHRMSSGFATKSELNDVREDLNDLGDRVDKHVDQADVVRAKYVTKEEYKLVKNIVFGAVALILVGFLGAVITFFIIGA